MTLFLRKKPNHIEFMARAEGPEAIGDSIVVIHPGETYLDKSYAQWRALPEGPIKID